jgi:hypothetical protein
MYDFITLTALDRDGTRPVQVQWKHISRIADSRFHRTGSCIFTIDRRYVVVRESQLEIMSIIAQAKLP